jgi:hypothetical protein
MQPFIRTINMAFLFLIFLSLSAVTLQAAIDSDLLEGLSARTLGPAAVSGRITAIDVVSSNPNHIVIGMAQSYVGSSSNAPTSTAETYMDLARQALSQGLEAMDQFMNGDLAEFIEAVDAAGIGLFRTATAMNQG